MLSLLSRLLRRCYLSDRTQLSLTVLRLLPVLGIPENTGRYPVLSGVPEFTHQLLWVKRRRIDPHQSALPRKPEELQQLTLQSKHVWRRVLRASKHHTRTLRDQIQFERRPVWNARRKTCAWHSSAWTPRSLWHSE